MILIDEFKNQFRALHRADLSRLNRLYADNVVFRDPLREMRGLVELEDYFASLSANLRGCRFEYLDELVGEGSAYVKWKLHFTTAGGQPVSLRGVSHLRWRDKIEFHEDSFDTGLLMRRQLSTRAHVTRWLRLRRAS